jgi:hypothetical protein
MRLRRYQTIKYPAFGQQILLGVERGAYFVLAKEEAGEK